MRNVCLLVISICAVLFAEPCWAQIGTGEGGEPQTPTVPHVNWSGIEAYVNGTATEEGYNVVDKGNKAEVKSSFMIANPTDAPITFSYETYVNGQLFSSIGTTTLGAMTSATIPQAFSSSNLQSDYAVGIRVKIDGVTVIRTWTFDIGGIVLPPL